MKHASDRQLLDLLSAGSPAQGELARHLEVCPDCRSRLERFAKTWEILGRAEPAGVPADLVGRIMVAAQRHGPVRPAGALVRLWQAAGPMGRVAAAVLAASAAGFALGRLTATPAGAGGETAPAVTQAQAAQAVHLDQICTPSTGLGDALNIAYQYPQEEQEQ